MTRVEFRLLQLIVSHVSGDRVTLGLVHWDYEQLRVAHSFSHLSFCDSDRREVVRRTVVAKFRKMERMAKGIVDERRRQGEFMLGLGEMLPVREGLGASLCWSGVQVSHTQNSQAHFDALKAELRLQEDARVRSVLVTNKDLTNRILTEGHFLEEQVPDRIRVSNTVHRFQSFTAPLSWKNGAWHHALPFSLDGLDQAGMSKRVRELVGIVQLCVPPEDVPVPVLVTPSGRLMADVARHEATVAAESLAERNVCLVAADRVDGDVSLAPLVSRIRSDVSDATLDTEE